MKKLLIFGITNFSDFLKATMEEDGISIDAFCVNRDYLTAETAEDGTPVVAFEDLDALYGAGNFEILISVGYHNMNEHRERIFNACNERNYGIASFVHSSVQCYTDDIGKGNIILRSCVLNNFSKIGNGNILVDSTVLGHKSTLGNFNFIAGATAGGLVEIGNNCFIGMKSIICEGRKVADYTLLGAGTILSKDTKPYTAVMPAANRTIRATADTLGSLLP